jgi:hypothetical protein
VIDGVLYIARNSVQLTPIPNEPQTPIPAFDVAHIISELDYDWSLYAWSTISLPPNFPDVQITNTFEEN